MHGRLSSWLSSRQRDSRRERKHEEARRRHAHEFHAPCYMTRTSDDTTRSRAPNSSRLLPESRTHRRRHLRQGRITSYGYTVRETIAYVIVILLPNRNPTLYIVAFKCKSVYLGFFSPTFVSSFIPNSYTFGTRYSAFLRLV